MPKFRASGSSGDHRPSGSWCRLRLALLNVLVTERGVLEQPTKDAISELFLVS
ncbi:MAG: hypothetical protein L3J22_02105 [Xanthomonadales bacterium]|nr:hypothetical protein [Xanthomonadales bacterium]